MESIEINGIKYEIDTAAMRRVSTYKVGDRVKVLLKDYSGYKTAPGVIVGFDLFQALPTIVVAYVPTDTWSTDADVKFAYLNAQTNETEIAPMIEDDLAPTKETILSWFKRSEDKLLLDLESLRMKREYFLRRFGSVIEEQVKSA